MKKRIRIQGFLIFIAVTLSIVLSKSIFPHWRKGVFDEISDAIGMTVVLFGFLLRIAARGYKAEKLSQGQSLVTDGPYGIIRNPMYFGTFLIGLGIIFILFNWWAVIIFLACFLLIYIPQISKEEKELSKHFDKEYQEYCKVTPKCFPKLLQLFTSNPRDYLFFRWQWVKKELPSLLATFSLILAIEVWEDVRLFGYIEFRKELLEFAVIMLAFGVISMIFYKK